MISRLRKFIFARPVIFIMKNHTAERPKRMNEVRQADTENWQYGHLIPDKNFEGGAYIESHDGRCKAGIVYCSIIVPV